MKVSSSEINYLTAIAKLSINDQLVTTNALAHEFDISAASVTEMIQRLAEKEFVRYEKYKGVALLPTGKQVAQKNISSRETWKQFLKEKLNLSELDIEQTIDEFMTIRSPLIHNRLEHYLNQRETPQAISKQLHIPLPTNTFTSHFETLNTLNIHESAQLLGISEWNNEVKRMLNHLSLTIGSMITVIDKFTFDNSMQIKTGEHLHLISNTLASIIQIKK